MNKQSMNLRRLAALAGLIAPALFVAVFTIEGWIRPGYSSLKMYVSALSLGSRGWIQMANFILLGLFMFVFTRGVAAEFESGKASHWGVILLTSMATLFMISGPFRMDPMFTPANQVTIHGTIHGLAGGIVFILMPIVVFVYFRRFRSDPEWQSLQRWTLVLGILIAVAVVFFTVISKSPNLQNTFINWLGLIQRTIIIPFMLWLFIFALKLYQINNQR